MSYTTQTGIHKLQKESAEIPEVPVISMLHTCGRLLQRLTPRCNGLVSTFLKQGKRVAAGILYLRKPVEYGRMHGRHYRQQTL